MTELIHVETGEIVPGGSDSGGLDKLAIAERMLAEATTVQDFLAIEDLAEMARVFAKQMDLGIGSVNYATAIKVQAGIRLAETVAEGQKAGVIAKQGRKSNRRNAAVSTLDDLGVKHQRVSEGRKLGKKYTCDQVRDLAEAYTAEGKELSRRQLLNGEAVQQSTTNEWYTPARYLDAARTVLGGIDLDPASCAEANETVQATRFLVEEDDGLTFEWHGRVWLNPPYGRIAGSFVDYLVDEYEEGHVTAAVALVNAHCTDTQWFQRLWPYTLCFTDHRIDFAAGTEERSGSTHGSVFVYLGPDPAAFADAFRAFGAVVRRWP